MEKVMLPDSDTYICLYVLTWWRLCSDIFFKSSREFVLAQLEAFLLFLSFSSFSFQKIYDFKLAAQIYGSI